MYSELNVKLKQAQEGFAKFRKIDAILQQLEIEKNNLKIREAEFKRILEKENKDVERIENKGIASMFYSVLGSLDSKIEIERKEALAASLKYEQVLKDLDDVKEKISEYSSERFSYKDSQRNYETYFNQKKEELVKEAGDLAHNIISLTEKINDSQINIKEIREAISVGEKALNSLDSVMASLDKAEGWGRFDLIGGGAITDLVKHQHLDNAKDGIVNVQRLLRNFKTELADINIDSKIMIETEGFARFADFFFDGLISDWFMQSKINSSQENVRSVYSQVKKVVASLKSMLNFEEECLRKYEIELNILIVEA